jgi:hypothetical protein
MDGWVALRKCVRCMQWLCCVFGVSTGLKFLACCTWGSWRFVDGNGENRFGSEEPDRPLVPLTSTDHDVPYPAGCRRPGNPTRGPKPTLGSRAGEFCTVRYPGGSEFWVYGILASWIFGPGSAHLDLRLSLCGCSLRVVWFFGFSSGRMARW